MRTQGIGKPGNVAFREGERPSASRLQETDEMVRSISGYGGTRVTYRPDGSIQISGGGTLDTWTYFGYRFKAATVLSIKARAVIMHSAGLTGNVAEQDINLSGSTAWVYAEMPRGATGSIPVPVRIATGRPSSDATYINAVLYRFDLSGGVWRPGHFGWWDVNLDMTVASR